MDEDDELLQGFLIDDVSLVKKHVITKNVNTKTIGQKLLLFAACFYHAKKVCAFLLSIGADPTLKMNHHLPICYACIYGRDDSCIEMLIQAYPNGVSYIDPCSRSLMYWLSTNIYMNHDNFVESVRLLILCGAPLNIRDIFEVITPLDCLIRDNRREAACLLMEEGIKPSTNKTSPTWVVDFIARREAVRSSVASWFLVARSSRLRSIIGKDMIFEVAKEIWDTRLNF